MKRREFIHNAFISAVGFLLLKNELFAEQNAAYKIDDILKKAKDAKWSELKINDIIIKVADEMLNVPYIGGTLDANDDEVCTINEIGLDCVTFMENSLCTARAIKKNKYSKDDVIKELTLSRYRDGKLNGYSSRLHYTKEWLLNNEKKGLIKNITKELGGVNFSNEVNFMSNNPKYYKHLKYNQDLTAEIGIIEKKINKMKILYIPKDKVKSIENKLNNGDIIAITTSKAALDYSHVGLIKVVDSKPLFMHASLNQKKVIIDTTISEYLTKVKTNTGITVARAV